MAEDKKSIALKVILQPQEKTFTDKEIERIANLLGGTDNNDGLLEQNEKDSNQIIDFTREIL